MSELCAEFAEADPKISKAVTLSCSQQTKNVDTILMYFQKLAPRQFRLLMLTPCLEAGSRARSEIEIDLKCIFGPGCNGAEGEAPLELQSFHQLPIIFSKLLFCS